MSTEFDLSTATFADEKATPFDLSSAKFVEQPVAEQPPEERGFLAEGRDIYNRVEEKMPRPGLIETVNATTAEVASGANESIIGFLDLLADTGNLAASGYNGLITLARGGSLEDAVKYVSPIPRPSEVIDSVLSTAGIESRPGDPVMEPGTGQQAARAFGNVFVPGALGMSPVRGRDLTRVPGQAAELFGFGSQAPAKTVASIVDTADDLARLQGDEVIRAGDDFLPAVRTVADDAPPIPPKSEKLARELALKRGRGDVAGAGFKLDDAGEVVADAAQQKALGVGIDKAIVAQVASASPKDKTRIGQMLDIVVGGLNNKTYADYHLPRVILGNSMFDRFKVISQANKKAGAAVAREVKKLGNIPLDGAAYTDAAIRPFFESLKELGVTVSRTGKLGFKGSRFEFSPGAQKVIRNTVKRMGDSDPSNLASAHKLKIMIDDMVDEYGRSSAGLSGTAENVLKELRHNTNEFIRRYSKEYADANTAYAETIDVINEVNRLIGKNNTVNKSTLSRTARQALSNAKRSDQVMAILDDLETIATRHGGEFSDNIKTQASVVQSIEKLFPSAKPPASFGGEIDKSMDVVMKYASGNTHTSVGDLLVAGGKRVFGKTDEKRTAQYIEALREIISSGSKAP